MTQPCTSCGTLIQPTAAQCPHCGVETLSGQHKRLERAAAAEAAARIDPRTGSALKRLTRGGGYLLRGWRFVVSEHPTLVVYCVAPVIIALMTISGVIALLSYYSGDMLSALWARPEPWYLVTLWYVVMVFAFLLMIVAGYVAFFVIQTILSSPFNDILTERVEMLAIGKEPPPFTLARFTKSIAVTLVHTVVKLSIYVFFMVPLILIGWIIPVVGPVISSVGGFIITAYFVSYDQMDFAMARREWSFGRKIRAVTKNLSLTFGFGGSMAGILFIPILGILFIPLAAVGGTLLFCDLEIHGAFVEDAPAQVAAPQSYPPRQ